MRHEIKIGELKLFRLKFGLQKLKSLSSIQRWRSSRLADLGLVFAGTMLVVSGAFAKVDVQSFVDRNHMDPGDALTLTVEISADESFNATAPKINGLSGFDLLNSWQSQQAKGQFVVTDQGREFKTIRKLLNNYMLRANKLGELIIPGAEVVVNGKTFVTKPIKIKVEKGASSRSGGARGKQQNRGSGPPPGFGFPGDEDELEDDLFSQLLRRQGIANPGGGLPGFRSQPVNPEEAFFVQVEVDKTEAFVNEQITASWYLYTRGQIKDLDTLKYPTLKGFWKEDIEIATRLNFTDEVVNGIPYKKALLASYALFPIQEGTALVDAYTAKCSVISGFDPFNLGAAKTYAYTKSSDELKIKVKPLPTEGRPSDFSGAVGSFQVTSRVEDPQVVAHQPFQLKVRFEGKGNAKLIDLPPFQVPEGFELYDTQKDAKFFRTGTSYKDFVFLLIPRKEGQLLLPGISVSLFDPLTKRYVQKTTDPLTIHVAPGKAPDDQKNSSDRTSFLGDLADKVEGKGKAALPGLWPQYEARSALDLRSQLSVTFVLFLISAAGLFWRARIELGWGQKKQDLLRRMNARFKKVDAHLQAGRLRDASTEVTNVIYLVLGEISGQNGAGYELRRLLEMAPPSVRRELGDSVTKLVDIFQLLTFAPEGMVEQQREREKIQKSVQDVKALLEKAVTIAMSNEQEDAVVSTR